MNAIEIITAWNTMTPEQQINFCTSAVYRAIKQGRTLKLGYDLEDATQETYAKMLARLKNVDTLEANCKRRESQGKQNTLAAVICRAASSTMEGIAYHSAKDSKATSRTITTEDGQEFDMLDSIAAVDDTEQAAILLAELRRFYGSLDDTNKTIFGGMVKGKTEREIAPSVGISHVAVHNRMTKIRTALAAIIF